MSDNYFDELNQINVNDKTEKKSGLTYLSWAWAWGEVKKLHPDANYKIYENEDGWNYFTDGRTCWVKTGVIINDICHIEYLPIMNYKNKSIAFDEVTSFDVNKAIQRSLTKACARHGLGLYIYAGEDLPEAEAEQATSDKNRRLNNGEAVPYSQTAKDKELKCEKCGNPIVSVNKKDGTIMSADEVTLLSKERTGKKLCAECLKNET